MSYSYEAWKPSPFAKRFAITFAQHALFHTPIVVVTTGLFA